MNVYDNISFDLLEEIDDDRAAQLSGGHWGYDGWGGHWGHDGWGGHWGYGHRYPYGRWGGWRGRHRDWNGGDYYYRGHDRWE